MTGFGLPLSYMLPNKEWQYSLFPACTTPAIMYPQDALSNSNDAALLRFGKFADGMMESTNYLKELNDAWAINLNAKMTQWAQLMTMMNMNNAFKFPGFDIGGTGNKGKSGSADDVDNDNKAEEKKRTIEDIDVWKWMGRLAYIDTYGDELNKKVTLKDGTNPSYVTRLVQLCKDYVQDNKLGLDEDEFETCRDVAEKIKATGKIERSDYLALKEIVDNHLSNEPVKEDDDDDDDDDDDTEGVSRSQMYSEGHFDAAGTNYSVAQLYLSAFNDGSTEGDDWKQANSALNAYNVVEVLDLFEENNDYGEDWITAVMDDVSDWHGSNGACWDDDKAKPIVMPVFKALKKRAKDLMKLCKKDNKLKRELENKLKSLSSIIDSFNGLTKNKDLSEGQKTRFANAFNDLVTVIRETEEEIYISV